MNKNLRPFLLLLLAFNTAKAQNLLINGDFEGANNVGYNVNGNGYNQIFPPFAPSTSSGNFAIFNNPASVNSQSFLPGGDHPTGAAAGVGAGTGNMMIIDGNNTGGNQRFWRAGTSGTGVNNLLTGAKYEFSYWIKTISNNGNLPFIDLQINNATSLTLALGTKLAPTPDSGWREVKYQFKASNSTVYIELWNTITEFVGNDFAVDDFSLKLIPPSATITGTTPLCENFTAATPIIFTGSNGINNNYTFTYSLNGSANQTITTNTGTATLDISTLTTGVYTYTLNNVSSGTSPLMSQNLNQDFVLAVQLEPNSTASIEGNGNICLNDINQNVTFTGAQGTAPYTFEYNINGGATQTATSTGNIFSLPINTAVPSSTIYNLLSVISSADSCKKILTASKTVVVNDVPNITAAIQSNAQICKDDTQNVIFSGFQGTSPYTFEYNINGGAIQTVTTINGNLFSLPIDTSVVTTVTYNLLSVISNSSSCKKYLNVSKTITINDLPSGTISAGTTVCSTATTPTLITFTGFGGTSPYRFTYTINDGTFTSNPITVSTAASSNSVDITFPTDYEGTYTYNLVSVASGSIPFCEKTLNLSETFVVSPPPTAVFTSGDVEFTCPGSQATLLISGTPNATVFFNTSSDLGPPFLQVVLDNMGNGSYLTPAIFATTEFNLIRAENGSCASSLNSSVKITLSYANTSLTGGTAFIKVEGPDIICEKFDDTSPIPPINIAATFNTIKTTSSYTVQSIPYQPQFNFESPNTIPIPPTGQNQDDFWSGATNTTPYTLPFKFGFYGNNYEQLTVGSNGVLSFNLTYQTPGNICPYVFPNNIPDGNAPIKNAIFGVYQDIIFNPLPTPTSSINYYVFPQLGCVEAKNRVFVMNTNKTYLYGDSTGASSGLQSYQIIMYETTNIIDVVVKRRKNATGWQNNLGIIGLIDGTGLQAKAAPGRNRNDVWQSLTGEAWRFIPAGIAKYTLKWYKNGAFLSEELNPTILPNGQVQSNISVPPVDGDFYTAKLVIQPVTAGDPTYNLEDTYVVNINATKFKKPVDVTVCGTDSNGDFVFNINQNTYMANGANAGNFDFGYYNSLQEAKDLASPINDSALLVLSATTVFPKTIYVNANDIATGCSTLLTFDLYGKKSPEGTFSYPDDGGEIGFCRSSNTALAPTPSVVFSPDGVYTVDPPIGLSIYSNTGVLDLTDALPGNYTITYKIAATESCPEYSTTATVKINLCTDLQIPSVACEDSIFTLSTTNAGSGVTYTWSDANGVITNTYETPTVNILAPSTSGSYIYTVVASIGTENSLPSSENLEVVNSPDATILTTTPGVCVGNPASITITSSPGAIVKYSVDGGAPIPITIEADGTNDITVNPATPQSVYQLVSAENPTSPSCTKTYTATSSNSNVTIITGEPAATISVSGTNPICTNSTSVIRFTGNGGATVHYSKNGVGDFTALIDATTGFVDVTTDVLTTSTDYDLMSIVVSGTNPCIKNYPSGSAKVTVIVNPLPTITGFSTTTAFICTNTKGSLTISGTANCNVVFTDGTTVFPSVLIELSGTVSIPTPNNLTSATTFSLVSITTNDALACSTTGLTQNVLIQISNGPSITTQPQTTTTICEGASDAVLSVTAVGASLSYQWNDGTNNVGTNSNTLNVPATLINDGKIYTCTITDACGVVVTSDSATVNVTAKPVFNPLQPQGTSPICAGADINLTATTTTSVGVTYKWFRGTTDLSTSNPTALTNNLIITNAQSTDSGDYTCVATTCSSVTSSIKTVTVNPLPVVTGFSAANASICSGTKASLEFIATPNSTIVYSDGTNTYNVPTLTGTVSVPTVNNLTSTTTFTLVSITNNLTTCLNTNLTNILPVTIGINALPTISDPTPISTLICSGDPATTLSVVATGSGLTYVWKNGSSIVANSNSSSISVPSIAANTGNYSCTITDVCGQTVTSVIAASLIINDAPNVTQDPIGSTICSGTTINLSIATTGTGLTYQWKKNGVDLPTTNPTATTINLVIVNAQTTDSGDYTCEAKSGTCSVTSPIAAMIVNQAPQVITQPVSNVYCTGDDITLSVGVSIPTVTYQWQFNGTDISGETNFELQLTNVNTANSGDYVCLINNLPCKQIKSNKAVILVKAAPFATIQSQTPNTTVCAGTDSNLIFNGTPNAKVTYTINGGANQILNLSPSGAATIITTGIIETTTTYQLVSISTNDFSPVCTTTLTDALTINVVAIPAPTLATDGFICVDENNVTQRKFRMETGLAASQYNFQWYEDNVAIAAPAGTNDFYEADKATTYTVEITDNATGCKRSAMTKITSSLQPKTVTATVLSGYFDDNATIEITADPINGDYEYQLDFGPFQDSNIFSNVPSGDHNVYARDKRECNTTAAFSINITNYPKFFTPNGDGINDYWNIFNLSNQINAKIYIFDRFGKFMKQISTTGQGWDGNFNTKPAAADDYWFVIKYEEQQINKEFKAHFTLKR